MSDANEPGGGVVPSARAERQRIRINNVSGVAIYALALAAISAAILAIVAWA